MPEKWLATFSCTPSPNLLHHIKGHTSLYLSCAHFLSPQLSQLLYSPILFPFTHTLYLSLHYWSAAKAGFPVSRAHFTKRDNETAKVLPEGSSRHYQGSDSRMVMYLLGISRAAFLQVSPAEAVRALTHLSFERASELQLRASLASASPCGRSRRLTENRKRQSFNQCLLKMHHGYACRVRAKYDTLCLPRLPFVS